MVSSYRGIDRHHGINVHQFALMPLVMPRKMQDFLGYFLESNFGHAGINFELTVDLIFILDGQFRGHFLDLCGLPDQVACLAT